MRLNRNRLVRSCKCGKFRTQFEGACINDIRHKWKLALTGKPVGMYVNVTYKVLAVFVAGVDVGIVLSEYFRPGRY